MRILPLARPARARGRRLSAFLDTYGAHRNTLAAATLDANVANHVFATSARRRAGTLEAAPAPQRRPGTGVPQPHRRRALYPKRHSWYCYTRLKRRALALDDLRDHDLAAPMFPDGEPTYSYQNPAPALRGPGAAGRRVLRGGAPVSDPLDRRPTKTPASAAEPTTPAGSTAPSPTSC
ncbi:MAG: hypothetical protein IPI34_15180 [bacterium]|nr:hypothetical protein [bacterium]